MILDNYKRRCPHCGSIHVSIGWLNPLNIILVPVNIILRIISAPGLPLFMKCDDCGYAYKQNFKNSKP